MSSVLFGEKGALMSSCGKYRYQLWRIWDDSLPKVLFIMLNPSTANHEHDDPTIRRCTGFAHGWGCGGLYVGNLFAYRSTDPKRLRKVENPVGDENNKYLLEMTAKTDLIVIAWGSNPPKVECNSLKGINADELHYLELAKNGHPKHTLYLRKELYPKPMITMAEIRIRI